MEYRSKSQCQAKMVKWRNVDAPTIARWVDESKFPADAGAEVSSAPCGMTREQRQGAQTQRSQAGRDRFYTFNSA